MALGYAKPIGDIYEGSPASRVTLEIYTQTRDELFDAGDCPRVSAVSIHERCSVHYPQLVALMKR